MCLLEKSRGVNKEVALSASTVIHIGDSITWSSGVGEDLQTTPVKPDQLILLDLYESYYCKTGKNLSKYNSVNLYYAPSPLGGTWHMLCLIFSAIS